MKTDIVLHRTAVMDRLFRFFRYEEDRELFPVSFFRSSTEGLPLPPQAVSNVPKITVL